MADSNVNTPCAEYASLAPAWERIDDVLAGTEQMRALREKYLPKQRLEDQRDYEVKIGLAVLYNGLAKAIDDATSRPFGKSVMFGGVDKVDESSRPWFDDFLADVDGSGTSADDLLRDAFEMAAKYGRADFLVDFTTVSEDATRADENAVNARPTIVLLNPKDVIGWKLGRSGSTTVLEELRVRERVVEIGDDWSEKVTRRVRVIRPGEVVVWTEQTDGKGGSSWTAGDPIPIRRGGRPLDRVPVFSCFFKRCGFMGARPPYEDLCFLNIAHWQSTAAQRFSTAFARIAALVISGHRPETDTSSNKPAKEIPFSPASVLRFPEADAKAYFAEQTGASCTAGREELTDLEATMQTLGVRPFVESSATSTATGKAIDEGREMSTIQRWIRTLERSFLDASTFAIEWAGVVVPEGYGVQIFSDFVLPASAADLAAIEKARSSGDLSRATYLAELQRRGTISPEIDVSAEIAAIEAEGPALGSMSGARSDGNGSGAGVGLDSGDSPAGGTAGSSSGGAGNGGGVGGGAGA